MQLFGTATFLSRFFLLITLVAYRQIYFSSAITDILTKNLDKEWKKSSELPSAMYVNTEIGLKHSEFFSELDKKPQLSNAAFLTKRLSPVLRQALVLTFESSTIPDFIKKCMKKALCSQNEVLHGLGGKSWDFRIRHRRGIMHFWHVYECHVYNRPASCPFNGHWSKWTSWGPCTVSCGHGHRERKRACNNPAPLNYGKFCSGSVHEREPCTKECPKNFKELAGDDPLKLQAFKTMKETEKSFPALKGTCSKDHCTFHEIHQLVGDDTIANQYWLSIHCIERFIGCPVDGDWSDWQPWSSCTSECGIGDRFRLRRCNDPAPSNGGLPCEGDIYEREDCLGLSCGGTRGNGSAMGQFPLWSDWSEWSKCSAKNCQIYGTEFSTRICVGLTTKSMCNVGDGSTKSGLERKRPCVKKGCLALKKTTNVTEEKLKSVPLMKEPGRDISAEKTENQDNSLTDKSKKLANVKKSVQLQSEQTITDKSKKIPNPQKTTKIGHLTKVSKITTLKPKLAGGMLLSKAPWTANNKNKQRDKLSHSKERFEEIS